MQLPYKRNCNFCSSLYNGTSLGLHKMQYGTSTIEEET